MIGAVSGSNRYDYLQDIQESTAAVLTAGGDPAAAYDYTDFGKTVETVTDTTGNEICYTGAVYDKATGEYYLNARYYDPDTAQFLSQDTYRGETEDIDQWYLYAYCANDPIARTDTTGNAFETVVDVLSIGWSLVEFKSNPSWFNLGCLIWDVGAAFLPFVPGSYTIKTTKIVDGTKKVSKITLWVADKTKDFKKTSKYLTIGQYKQLRKIFKGRGKTVECHHIIEKRFNHLALKKSEYPAVAISPKLHKIITKRWRRAIPYKNDYSKLTKKQLKKAAKKVYSDMPKLKAEALKIIDLYYK